MSWLSFLERHPTQHAAIPTSLTAENNYKLNIETLKQQINSMGLSCVFASNPRNPTGEAVSGEELKQLVALGRESSCTMVLDEFYSAYCLDNVGTPQEGEGLSAARYIEGSASALAPDASG